MHSLNCSMCSNGGDTLYTKGWKRGGGNPNLAFLLLFHDNPASRTTVNDIPNIVFFPNPASDLASSEAVKSRFPSTFPECRTVFWSNPGCGNILPDPAIHPPSHPLAVFPDLCAVPTIWTPRTEASRRKYYICRVQNFFLKNSWFHWREVFTALQLVFTDLALIFWASFAGHLKAVPQITFSYSMKLLMQSKLLQKPTSDFSWLLTPLGVDIKID